MSFVTQSHFHISALWFLYLIVYSYFWPIGLPLGENFAGMVEIVGSAPLFYFCMLLAPIAALMTDVVFITVQTTLFPDETDRARAKEKGKYGDEMLSENEMTDIEMF